MTIQYKYFFLSERIYNMLPVIYCIYKICYNFAGDNFLKQLKLEERRLQEGPHIFLDKKIIFTL